MFGIRPVLLSQTEFISDWVRSAWKLVIAWKCNAT